MKNTNITTIKLDKSTKNRIDKLKIHEKESYDKTLQKILSILNTLKQNPFQARTKLEEIDTLKNKIKRAGN